MNFSSTLPPVNEVCIAYFVRPGSTVDNIEGKWSGPDETPLSNVDFPAIKALESIRFDYAYYSRAKRTRQTAEIIFDNSKHPKPPCEEVDCLYEMEIGSLENQTPQDIVNYFKRKTKYPNESTKEELPKLWQRKKGEDPTANECLLDKWEENIDTFDSFCEKIGPELTNIVNKHMGQTILFVGHGTPAKWLVAQTQRDLHVIDIECKKECFFKVVFRSDGTFTLQKDMCKDVSLLNGRSLELK